MLLAFALICASCTAFCFAMDRHMRQIWPQCRQFPRSSLIFRCSGITLLCASTIVLCHLQGVAVGLVSVFGLLTLAISLVALLLSYYPRALLGIAWSTPLLALLQMI